MPPWHALLVFLSPSTATLPSGLLLLFPTLLALLIVFLQHTHRIKSPFHSAPPFAPAHHPPRSPPSSPSNAPQALKTCANCLTSKPLHALKKCRACDTKFEEPIYFCDRVCQRQNWKFHKSICASDPSPEQNLSLDHRPSRAPTGLFKNLIPGGPPHDPLLGPSELPWQGLGRPDIEKMLKRWCDYHKHLLIFATIHGLDLIRSPSRSAANLLIVSLKPSKKVVHSSHVQSSGPALQDSLDALPDHQLLDLLHLGCLDSNKVSSSNPGLRHGFSGVDDIRKSVQSKGGFGVAMTLVTCGSVVQIIPVGLPSKADLQSVKVEPHWRPQFDAALVSGIKWQPAPSAPQQQNKTAMPEGALPHNKTKSA